MEQLRTNFEKFYEASKADWEPVSIKELLWKFYCQGHNDPTPVGKELSEEEVKKMIDDQCFIEFIQSCIESCDCEQSKSTDFVEVCYPCTAADKSKCIAWPDRCEDVGGDGTVCKKIINLSKLCGVAPEQTVVVRDKSLVTDSEAKQLSEILTNYFNSKETL